MKITIITVCYNSEACIRNTIQSVIKQDYNNLEYIIIDGGSKDRTLDIIREYQDKIAYWISESDEGVYDAMNKGIELASGEYILFLGSDDVLASKDSISKIAANIDSETDEIICGWVLPVDSCHKFQEECYEHVRISDVLSYINSGHILPHQAMFVKTSIMKKYKFDTYYKIAADYNFLMQVCDFVKIKILDIRVAIYNLDGLSLLSNKTVDEYIDILSKKNQLDKEQKKYILKLKIKSFFKKVFLGIGLWEIIVRLKKRERHCCKKAGCNWYKND